MGASDSRSAGHNTDLGFHSTAKQVIESFGTGNYLQGKTALVTGGTSGLGLETCKALAYAGAKVILCARSISKAEKAIEDEIKKEGRGKYVVSSPNIVIKQLDLNSLKSVKAFAEDILQTEERLDFLVLNAGIMAIPRLEYTEDGFERQIGVNHFGHAYLTRLLLPKMKETPDTAGRLVFLSSSAHNMGKLECDDLHFKHGRRYYTWGAYGQSKLANLLYAKALADRLEGTNLSVVAVHPGVIKTNLWKASFSSNIVKHVVHDKNIPEGAATTVWACISPRVVTDGLSGSYLADCGPSVPTVAGQDKDKTLRNKLWEVTEKQLDEATKNF